RERVFGPIHRNRLLLPEVEGTNVVQPQNVIGVRVRVEDRVQAVQPGAQHLLAKIGRGVHHHITALILEQDRRAQALVARIGRRAHLAGASDGRDAGTGARAEHRQMDGRRAHSYDCDASPAAGFEALSLTCTNRNRSSVNEFSMSRCSSRLRLPRVFSASIPSVSIACRAAGKSGAPLVSSPIFSRPRRISACILSENTRNSKVAGGSGMPDSDIAFYL